jgi:hypothetical protein
LPDSTHFVIVSSLMHYSIPALFRWLLLSLAPLLCTGCAATDSPPQITTLESQVTTILTQIQQQDPNIQAQIDRSYGFALFPSIVKIAAGIDIGYGRGIVFQHHRQIGQASVLQYNVGAALGGQQYWQLILLPEKTDLDDLRDGPTVAVGNASGILIHSGSALTLAVPSGSASMVQPTTGLMFEVAIGGQTFWFQNLKPGEWNYTSAAPPTLAARTADFFPRPR